MEDFLKWRESWLTGVESLDVQHAELAACLNSIAKMCFSEEGQASGDCSGKAEQLEKLVSQLYDMTRQHFKHEEQLMLDKGYPGYPTHIHEHGMLLAELKLMMRTRFKKGSENIDPETLKALKSWFIAHIAHSDKLFAQFVARNNSVDASPGDSQ
jgi:hemerythrin